MRSLDSWNLRLLAVFITVAIFSVPARGDTTDAIVTGAVTEAGNGAVVEGATVIASRSSANSGFGSGLATTTTDSNGSYQLIIRMGGSSQIDIVVEAAGPEHAPARFGGEPRNNVFFGDFGTDGAFSVTPGLEVTGIDFALERGARVSGTITNMDTGDALPNAFVEFQFTDLEPLLSFSSHFNGVADASGNYQSALALPAGEYVLRAVPEASENFVIQAWEGVSCELRSCPPFTLDSVELQSGQVVTDIDFALKPGASILGTLNPLEVPNKRVNLFDAAGFFLGSKNLAPDSDAWSFSGLAGGSYYIEFSGVATGDPSAFVRVLHNGLPCPFGGCGSRAIGLPITVSAGSTRTDVDIELQQGGQVSGALVSGDGNPVPFQSGTDFYDVIDTDSVVVGGGFITEDNGQAVLRPSGRGIPPGEYFVRTFADFRGTGVGYEHFGRTGGTAPGFADGMYPDTSCAGRDCDLNQAIPVTITAGEITDIVLEIFPGSDITGRVVDENTGEGIGSALVKLVDVDDEMFAAVFANANGDFSFGGFPAGTYYLRTSMAGRPGDAFGGAQTPYFDTVHGSATICSEALCDPFTGDQIVLDGSTNAGPIELRLATGPVIRGQIIDDLTGDIFKRGNVVVFDGNDNFVARQQNLWVNSGSGRAPSA